MLVLLTALLQALAEAARALTQKLKNDAIYAPYEFELRLARDIEALEDEIETLRARGDDAAQLRADRLRQRLLARQGIAAAVSAARAPAQGGPAGGDGDGSLHTGS